MTAPTPKAPGLQQAVDAVKLAAEAAAHNATDPFYPPRKATLNTWERELRAALPALEAAEAEGKWVRRNYGLAEDAPTTDLQGKCHVRKARAHDADMNASDMKGAMPWLRARVAELEAWNNAAPLCEKHHGETGPCLGCDLTAASAEIARLREAGDFLQSRYDANGPYIKGLETRVKVAEEQRDEARAALEQPPCQPPPTPV